MKKTTTSIAILLLLAGTFFSCNNEKEEYFDEPIDVPFTVFSKSDMSNLKEALLGTSCGWGWMPWPPPPQEIIIINSVEELQNILRCSDENDFPIIDFSKYTLLFARGAFRGIVIRSIGLQQLSSRTYKMSVVVALSSVPAHWHAVIITEKLDKNARVKLNVT